MLKCEVEKYDRRQDVFTGCFAVVAITCSFFAGATYMSRPAPRPAIINIERPQMEAHNFVGSNTIGDSVEDTHTINGTLSTLAVDPFNYFGYNDGQTQFRDLVIQDGRSSEQATCAR